MPLYHDSPESNVQVAQIANRAWSNGNGSLPSHADSQYPATVVCRFGGEDRVVPGIEGTAGTYDCSSCCDVNQGLLDKRNARTENEDNEEFGPRAKMARALLAEAIGTFMIVVGGCGVVCTAVTTGAQAGIWHVAVVWGFTVTLAIYCTADASGAHLNPAITLAFWLVRPEAHGMNWRSVLAYMAAQLLGGIMGGALNLAIFAESFAIWEKKNNIVRGSPESVVTAAAFGEYFPNPGFVPSRFEPDSVSVGMAFVTEAWGTLILAFVIFSVTCKRNGVLSGTGLQPFFIGFTVAVLLSLYAPITQAGWNPARDFGPRIVAALAGWGSVAIPGPRNGFWVYIVAPLVGGPLGAFLAEIGLWGKWWKRLDGRRVGHSESQREMCRQC